MTTKTIIYAGTLAIAAAVAYMLYTSAQKTAANVQGEAAVISGVGNTLESVFEAVMPSGDAENN